jgi:putative thioredoxin
MVDVTDATFETEVLQRSETAAVVVDLWAPWCGPCRTLGPILEQVVGETDGEVVLAKVNTDENPGLSDLFQVQGIPAVYAVKDRKVVSQFVGAQPESVVRQFVDGLRPTEEDRRLAALLAAGDEASLRQVLEAVPDHPRAIVALAELLVGQGRQEEALALLAKIPESAETRRVAALARTSAVLGDDVIAAVEGGGDRAAPGADVEATLDALLPRVKEDDAARQEFLDLLELMGPADPRTAPYRKALSRQLF